MSALEYHLRSLFRYAEIGLYKKCGLIATGVKLMSCNKNPQDVTTEIY